MIVLECILVVIGLGAIIMSYRIADKKETGSASNVHTDTVDKVRKEMSLHDVEQVLAKKKEDIVMEAAEELSKLSNEKIMGMNEYSNQVLDKIEHNHGEAVFLYNMLTEKEDELKELVHHIDRTKAQLHDDMAKEYQNSLANEIESANDKYTEQTETIGVGEYSKTPDVLDEKNQQSNQADSLRELFDQEEIIEEIDRDSVDNSENHNEEILSLYRKGDSILEISRLLGIGQGEVKFVIDLYKSKK